MPLSARDTVFYAGASSVHEKNAEQFAYQKWANELKKPLPKITDPLIKVRVLDPFRHGSPGAMREAAVDDIVEIPTSLAHSLQAIGRCEIV